METMREELTKEAREMARAAKGVEMPGDAEIKTGLKMPAAANKPAGVEVPAGAEIRTGLEMPGDAGLAKQVRHQMRVIKQGASELIGEEELEAKITRSILTGTPLTVKFGMDPSAPDIHLGHAAALRKLKQMQDLGHNIVVVIGDFTAKIGDPTGKSKGRKAMTESEVFVNAQTYQEQIFRILDREKTQVRFNGEWLELLNLNEVLRMASMSGVPRRSQ